MQKLADGQDTDTGFSAAWLWSRCVGTPQAGAVPAGEVPAGEVAGWPRARELVPGPDGADEPLHPVAAPVSRMATQAKILVICAVIV
jgi:hypothetical protein